MKVFEVMGDGYITEKEALNLFESKTDEEKIKILKKALLDKCDNKGHMNWMILKHTKEVAYSDVWGDDKKGFLYKLLTWKKRKK